jgi:hypothetical protein
MSAASPHDPRIAVAVEHALGERMRAAKADVGEALPAQWLELVAKIEFGIRSQAQELPAKPVLKSV